MDTASAELEITLRDLRRRVMAGEDIDPEEYEILVASLRLGRKAGKTKKISKNTETSEEAVKEFGANLKDLLNTDV